MHSDEQFDISTYLSLGVVAYVFLSDEMQAVMSWHYKYCLIASWDGRSLLSFLLSLWVSDNESISERDFDSALELGLYDSDSSSGIGFACEF